MKLFKVIALTLLFSLNLAVFAETIRLKSGRSVQGEIIEKTDEYIRVNLNGLSIKYYIDEIESIDGQTLEQSGEKEKEEIFYVEKENPKKWDEWYTADIEEYINKTKKILSKSADATDQAINNSLKSKNAREREKINRNAQNQLTRQIHKLEITTPLEGFQSYHDSIISACKSMSESLQAVARGENKFAARKLAYVTMAMDAMKELRAMFNDHGASQEAVDDTSLFIEDVFLK